MVNDPANPALTVREDGWVTITGGPKFVSINDPEPFCLPAVKYPRPRTLALAGKLNPASCHPPATRLPAVKPKYALPLVENSKVVRENSGPVPPRSQFTVAPSNVRLCDGAPVLFNRAIRDRACPDKFVKAPPAMTFPSPWITSASTLVLAGAAKLASSAP